MHYLYIAFTIIFTVIGQLLSKWRMKFYIGKIPLPFPEKFHFVVSKLIWDPYIICCYLSAFLASICWLMVLTKLELSYAYPFTALTFVLIFIFSLFLFGESFDMYKLIGTLLILAGVSVMYRGGYNGSRTQR